MVDALQILEDFDLTQGICEQVPYSLIYPSENRYGRISPRHPDYSLGSPLPPLPKGRMVFHSLTQGGGGIIAREEALNRLESMVAGGGLHSTAERRRLGISVTSLDPVGDTHQGIDVGVPASIGKVPGYQSSVYFLLRPEVLQRRDIWFSPTTGWSYDHYQKCAKKIGQAHFLDPCPVEARAQHLTDKHSLANAHNEVFFTHQISWDEVAELLITDKKLYEDLCDKAKAWRQKGYLPESVNIRYTAADRLHKAIVHAHKWATQELAQAKNALAIEVHSR
jgi:hypothetical protein